MNFNFQQKVVLLFGGACVCFMLFFLSRSYYQDFKLHRQIDYFTYQNKKIDEQIEILQSQVGYYQTENYKDKYAKEYLNKLNSGEKMLVLKTISIDGVSIIDELSIPPAALAPRSAWKKYFFGKDNLEERVE